MKASIEKIIRKYAPDLAEVPLFLVSARVMYGLMTSNQSFTCIQFEEKQLLEYFDQMAGNRSQPVEKTQIHSTRF